MSIKDIVVPDIGDFDSVEVIELLVAIGDTIAAEDSLITVESDKASMEIPSSDSGTVTEIKVALGDMISEGAAIITIEASDAPVETAESKEESESESTSDEPSDKVETETEQVPVTAESKPAEAAQPPAYEPKPSPTAKINEITFSKAYASPSVRKFARELGVDLGSIDGSGRKNRILREDVKGFVKQTLTSKTTSQSASSGLSLGIPAMPEIDFSQFGEIESKALSKINKLTGEHMSRSWLSVPHVTQFDEADITEMEAFRKQMGKEMERDGIKITPLAFIIKAVVTTLQTFPRFNSSLDSSGENLIIKKYFHIGVAVDTPDGLVVPVIRDANTKSIVQISQEIRELAVKARDKKLKPADMQGGCFTISSLGGIGGTKFTPIVNAPEVAILGVSKAKTQPEWNGSEFEPRLMMPLSLSYDHRVIDGADGARFTSYLSNMLTDIRRILL